MFNRALSLNERNTVGSYLNQKYGLVTNAPPAPTNFQAIALSPAQMSLVYNSNASNVTWINLERKEGSVGTYAQIGTMVGPSFTFIDNLPSTTAPYYYRATCYNYFTNSASIVIAPPIASITNPVSFIPISRGTNVMIYLHGIGPVHQHFQRDALQRIRAFGHDELCALQFHDLDDQCGVLIADGSCEGYSGEYPVLLPSVSRYLRTPAGTAAMTGGTCTWDWTLRAPIMFPLIRQT